MRRQFVSVCFLLLHLYAASQNVGIGTTTPLSKLHIQNGGLLITGDNGVTPVTGEGNRFMWVPAKAASRAGQLDVPGADYWNEDSIGYYSLAVGKNVRATGDSASIALGWYSRASGKFGSIALGDFAHASGNSGASAIGGYVTASGISSIAIGQNANALGNYSQSIGNSSISSGYASHTVGTLDTASSGFSYSIGYRAITEEPSIGNFAIGYQVKSSSSSFALGHFSDAIGQFSMTAGRQSQTSGSNSYVYGSTDTASGSNSIVVGLNNKGTANFSKVFGNNSIASGNGSMALGAGVTSTGAFSVSIGNSSLSSNNEAFTLGTFDTATAQNSFAIGNWSKATGNYSIALGTFAKANAYSSFSIGNGSIANGINSLSLGNFSTAAANYSVVMGYSNLSEGEYGLCTGYSTRQKAYGGFTAGLFNDDNDASIPYATFASNRIFQIGNGTANNARSNAMTVLQNGNIGIGILNPELSLVVKDDIRIDANNENNGTIGKGLRFGNNVTGEAIASKRTAGGNQWGLDFYTDNQVRLAITNSGTVQVNNNITVQNGKGIIRSTDGTQKKQLSASVTVNTSFLAGETKQFTVTWSETFSTAPEAYVGNVTGGTGGWAEVVMTIFNTTATGATLYVYNPRTVSASPNFTIKVIAIGAQ